MAMEITRAEKKLVLKVDIPGLELGDVKIELEDHVLTVSGEHAEKRRFEYFYESTTVPESVKPEDIEKAEKDGVIEVTVPLAA